MLASRLASGCTRLDSRIGLQGILDFCAVNTIFFSSVCFQFYARPSHTVLFLLFRVRWLPLSAFFLVVVVEHSSDPFDVA